MIAEIPLSERPIAITGAKELMLMVRQTSAGAAVTREDIRRLVHTLVDVIIPDYVRDGDLQVTDVQTVAALRHWRAKLTLS